jgi:putative flippase GtrA
MAAAQPRLARYAQFLGGGVICAALHNLILIVGDWLGYGYLPLVLFGYLVSVTVGYFYHCRITFDEPISWRGYTLFSAGIWLGMPLSFVILLVLGKLLGLPMWVAAPAMTCIMLGYNYSIARLSLNLRANKA